MKTENTYQVVDTKTNKIMKTFANRDKAVEYADMKDKEYGAVRYVVKYIPKA